PELYTIVHGPTTSPSQGTASFPVPEHGERLGSSCAGRRLVQKARRADPQQPWDLPARADTPACLVGLAAAVRFLKELRHGPPGRAARHGRRRAPLARAPPGSQGGPPEPPGPAAGRAGIAAAVRRGPDRLGRVPQEAGGGARPDAVRPPRLPPWRAPLGPA